jgi:hypothetical protein
VKHMFHQKHGGLSWQHKFHRTCMRPVLSFFTRMVWVVGSWRVLGLHNSNHLCCLRHVRTFYHFYHSAGRCSLQVFYVYHHVCLNQVVMQLTGAEVTSNGWYCNNKLNPPPFPCPSSHFCTPALPIPKTNFRLCKNKSL